MKVATYNVNGVNGRLPRLLEWLADAGYASIWHGQRAHQGVGILAKGERPLEIRRGWPGDELDTQARCLEAEVKGLRVASVPASASIPSG